MNAKNWCEIYIDGKISGKEIAQEVCRAIDAKVCFSDGELLCDLQSLHASISVEWNENVRNSKSDEAFLFFPWVISSQQTSGDEKAYEFQITKIIQSLRSKKLTVAVVSDFFRTAQRGEG